MNPLALRGVYTGITLFTGEGGAYTKRKAGLLLTAAAVVGVSMTAAIGTAHAAATSWMGPFSTSSACNSKIQHAQVTRHNGRLGYDFNHDGTPDAGSVGPCPKYSDGFWFSYTAF